MCVPKRSVITGLEIAIKTVLQFIREDYNMNILFIGNSYTYVNDMPKLFETIAKDNGKDVNVFSVTKGGHKLHLYARENNEYTQKIDSLISENLFDICFFQEQSCLLMPFLRSCAEL